MVIGTIDRIKLRRKEKKFKKLAKSIFEKAENPQDVVQIKKQLTTLHFELYSLSPKYLHPSNEALKNLEIWIKSSLEEISIAEHFATKYDKGNPDPELWWAFIEPSLRNAGNTFLKTYFDFNEEELRLILPIYGQDTEKTNHEKIYAIGEAYEYVKDLSKLVENAKNEVIITDRYPNEEMFLLYLEKVSSGVRIRVLTREDIDKKFVCISNKFKLNSSVNYELRKSSNWHDRLIFVDNTCWVSGQTLKDAAVKAPTYLIKLDAYDELRTIFEEEWLKATLVN